MSTRIVYQQELEDLNRQVQEMGAILQTSIDKVIEAMDVMDEKLAHEIIAADDKIDAIECSIETACITLIAKQAPIATDLRRIVSYMCMIADIERIADHCSDISEYIIELSNKKEVPMPGDDTVDDYFKKIKTELSTAMEYNPDRIEQYTGYLMIIKYIERMADHSTNIAHWISFIITGELEL